MTDMLNRGEKPPRRLHQPLHLLRRPGRCRTRRSRRPRRPHHRHAHGQVHPPDALETGLLGMVGKADVAPPPSTPSATTRPSTSWPSAAPPTSSPKPSRAARVLAFEDLGMEAIYEFDVVDMPVTVAVDAKAPASTTPAPPSGQAASPPPNPYPESPSSANKNSKWPLLEHAYTARQAASLVESIS